MFCQMQRSVMIVSFSSSEEMREAENEAAGNHSPEGALQNGVAKDEDNKDSVAVKPKKEKPKFELLHDIAAFHVQALRKRRERQNLLHDVGSFRRALCARRDLRIRQILCKEKVRL